MTENSQKPRNTKGTFSPARIILVIMLVGLGALGFLNRHDIASKLGTSLQKYARQAQISDGNRLVETTLYALKVDEIVAPADPGEGGAIAAFGEDIYLLTRLGDFLRLNETGDQFAPIALKKPNAVVQSDVFYSRRKDFASLGFKDLILRPAGDNLVEITVSQARVNTNQPCVNVVVHQTKVTRDILQVGNGIDQDPKWREIWQSTPCIENASGSFPFQSGGDMAFLPDGRLAIFVGDFGIDGHNRKMPGFGPQDLSNQYGKVIAIDVASGASEILSRGHRNPGGLAVNALGELWQAEHAAQGGDEINKITAGSNYGWPLETYGAHYGMRTWPLDATVGEHGRFTKPVYSFVPSMAMSSLDFAKGDEFTHWRGDLILGTLKYKRLMRLHIREDRVIFAEPIRLGARVRDLTIDARGRIYVKDDTAPIVYRLTRHERPNANTGLQAKLAQAGCTACHNTAGGGAPEINDIYGKKIARTKFSYSPALSAKNSDIWDEVALRAYLLDPQAFAPGTQMPAPDLNEQAIDALINDLRANADP